MHSIRFVSMPRLFLFYSVHRKNVTISCNSFNCTNTGTARLAHTRHEANNNILVSYTPIFFCCLIRNSCHPHTCWAKSWNDNLFTSKTTFMTIIALIKTDIQLSTVTCLFHQILNRRNPLAFPFLQLSKELWFCREPMKMWFQSRLFLYIPYIYIRYICALHMPHATTLWAATVSGVLARQKLKLTEKCALRAWSARQWYINAEKITWSLMRVWSGS